MGGGGGGRNRRGTINNTGSTDPVLAMLLQDLFAAISLLDKTMAKVHSNAPTSLNEGHGHSKWY